MKYQSSSNGAVEAKGFQTFSIRLEVLEILVYDKFIVLYQTIFQSYIKCGRLLLPSWYKLLYSSEITLWRSPSYFNWNHNYNSKFIVIYFKVIYFRHVRVPLGISCFLQPHGIQLITVFSSLSLPVLPRQIYCFLPMLLWTCIEVYNVFLTL